MTVFIDNAEFTQRLQRENNELLAENRRLRKLIFAIATGVDDWAGEDMDILNSGWLTQEDADAVIKIVNRMKG
jgi:hypothetical protein